MSATDTLSESDMRIARCPFHTRAVRIRKIIHSLLARMGIKHIVKAALEARKHLELDSEAFANVLIKHERELQTKIETKESKDDMPGMLEGVLNEFIAENEDLFREIRPQNLDSIKQSFPVGIKIVTDLFRGCIQVYQRQFGEKISHDVLQANTENIVHIAQAIAEGPEIYSGLIRKHLRLSGLPQFTFTPHGQISLEENALHQLETEAHKVIGSISSETDKDNNIHKRHCPALRMIPGFTKMCWSLLCQNCSE